MSIKTGLGPQPSIDAVTENARGAQVAEQEEERGEQRPQTSTEKAEARGDRGPAKTQSKGAKADADKPEGARSPDGRVAQAGERGIGSLAKGDELAGSPALGNTQIVQLIMGQGELGMVREAPAEADAREAIGRMFKPFLSRLADKPVAPGGRFDLDGCAGPIGRSVELPFRPLAWLAREAVVDPKLQATSPRVSTVLRYQAILDKFFAQDKTQQLRDALVAMPLPAQKETLAAASTVARIASAFRAQEPKLWNRLSLDGKPEGLKRKLAEWKKIYDAGSLGSVKDTDIEIPGLDVVAEEALHETLTTGATKLKSQVERIVAAEGRLDPALGVDWDSADVEQLLILVMMMGVKVEDDLLRDNMKEMARANRERDQLRKLTTSAKQNQARVERELQDEFNGFKADGTLAESITFDQYKEWRQIDFAALNEDIDENGERSYALPGPQLRPITADDIPLALKTGKAEGGSLDDVKGTQKLFGLPPAIDRQLRKLYEKMKPEGQSYPEWLQQRLDLATCADVDDVIDNLKQVQSKLKEFSAPGYFEDELRTLQAANLDKIEGDAGYVALKQAYTDYIKAQMLEDVCPERVNDVKLAELKRKFDSLYRNQTSGTPVSNEAREAFAVWMHDAMAPEGDLGTFRAKVTSMVTNALNVSAYDGAYTYSPEKNFDKQMFEEEMNKGRDYPGQIELRQRPDGTYYYVKIIEIDQNRGVDSIAAAATQGAQQGGATGAITAGFQEAGKAAGQMWDTVASIDGKPKTDDFNHKYKVEMELPLSQDDTEVLSLLKDLGGGNVRPGSLTIVSKDQFDQLDKAFEITHDGIYYRPPGKGTQVFISHETMREAAAIGLATGVLVGGAALFAQSLIASPIAAVYACFGPMGWAMAALILTEVVAISVVTGVVAGGLAAGGHVLSEAEMKSLAEVAGATALTSSSLKPIGEDQLKRYEELPTIPSSASAHGNKDPITAKADELRAAVNEVSKGFSDVGVDSGIQDAPVGTKLRDWTREVGLDREYNRERAEAKKRAGRGSEDVEALFDPATGLRLDQRGTLAYYQASVQAIQDKLDTLNGFTEIQQMRLQKQMEQRSKFFETLSNLLKAISQTEKTIRDNMR